MITKAKKIVVKFGGSNLKRKEDISSLIKAVQYYRQPVVIVISALYGVTDRLEKGIGNVTVNEESIHQLISQLSEAHQQVINRYIDNPKKSLLVLEALTTRIEELEKYLRGIHCLGESPDFAEDRILSYGERLSSLLLTAILSDQGFDCVEVLPEDLGLFTNGEYRNATVDFNRSKEVVKQTLSQDRIYVIPGFYGISRDAKVTLLGRGGSDYTAAAIARCIDAQSVDLWKDVPGFMSADPKVVDNPDVIPGLTYNEAAELSYFGAQIAHPRTFEPLVPNHIPVRLFNINDFCEKLEPVTVIDDRGLYKQDIIKSVTSSDNIGVLKLYGAGVGDKPGILAKATSYLTEESINIKSVITSQTCINILLSQSDLVKGLDVLNQEGLWAVNRIIALDNLSLIAVVGEGLLEQPGVAARALSAVSALHINILTISAGASNVAVYFILEREDSEKAVQAIHDEFFPADSFQTVERGVKIRHDHSFAATLGYVV